MRARCQLVASHLYYLSSRLSFDQMRNVVVVHRTRSANQHVPRSRHGLIASHSGHSKHIVIGSKGSKNTLRLGSRMRSDSGTR
jgi:hypothetical protein